MFYVQKRRCNECLFSENKIVSDERKEQLIADILREDGYFCCHKSQIEKFEYPKNSLCCRGWYDKYGDRSQLIRIAKRMKMPIRFINIPSEEEK